VRHHGAVNLNVIERLLLTDVNMPAGLLLFMSHTHTHTHTPHTHTYEQGSIMERLILTDVDMPAGLRHFMSANEVPPALADWRSALKEEDNVGLALRWVAAIEEMEPFLELPVEVCDCVMTHDCVAQTHTHIHIGIYT